MESSLNRQVEDFMESSQAIRLSSTLILATAIPTIKIMVGLWLREINDGYSSAVAVRFQIPFHHKQSRSSWELATDCL